LRGTVQQCCEQEAALLGCVIRAVLCVKLWAQVVLTLVGAER
jgi:hypothetical protein